MSCPEILEVDTDILEKMLPSPAWWEI